jgi:hypothetical protein
MFVALASRSYQPGHSGNADPEMCECARALAHVVARDGRLEQAVRVDGAVQAWYALGTAKIVPRTFAKLQATWDARFAEARSSVGSASASAALSAGQMLTLNEAIAEGLAAANRQRMRKPDNQLTAREIEVTRLLMEGKTQSGDRRVACHGALDSRTPRRQHLEQARAAFTRAGCCLGLGTPALGT